MARFNYLLHHSIETWAECFPEKDAFRYYDQSLKYSALNRRANALAHCLIDNGVARGDRVGIFMNKSIETPIALYGIMKAGAAYVPLDPASPVERLSYVLNHCGIRHIVTHKSKVRKLRALPEQNVALDLCIGLPQISGFPYRTIEWESVNQFPATAPGVAILEQDLAYIMYTSGSTGEPKGIMHSHYSGLSYAKLSAELYRITPDDRLSNHSPLHFDMSTLDYFSGPLAGATTVIIPEEFTRMPASLSKLIEDEKLTIWYSVSFALVQLLLRGALEKRDLSSLRLVLFGGEVFPTKHLRELMKRWPQAAFSNVYGPAEVNQCTFYLIPELSEDDDRPVPIGHIWPNTEALILDENNMPAAVGEPGELLIRSATMMRGYWRQPELTARAFYRITRFPNHEEVFYRTGDLVMKPEDGLLRFLGRKDRQVKLRGHRVELDEIEAATNTHQAVEECGAYPLPDAEGSNLVEVAVTVKSSHSISESELLKYLKSRLPPYAVPTKILLLEAFPRTGTGKIDRRALAEIAQGKMQAEKT